GIRLSFDRIVEFSENVPISIRGEFGGGTLLNPVPVWSRPLKSGGIQGGFSFSGIAPATHSQVGQFIVSGDRSWIEQGYPRDRVWRSFWYLITTFWRVSAPSA